MFGAPIQRFKTHVSATYLCARVCVFDNQPYCVVLPCSDSRQIVDLGCGWGSLTLFLAEKYPNSSITSISNSASQKTYIDGQCKVKRAHKIQREIERHG